MLRFCWCLEEFLRTLTQQAAGLCGEGGVLTAYHLYVFVAVLCVVVVVIIHGINVTSEYFAIAQLYRNMKYCGGGNN